MKKLLILLFMLITTAAGAMAADIRFVQVDGAFFDAYNENSIKSVEKLISKINSIMQIGKPRPTQSILSFDMT